MTRQTVAILDFGSQYTQVIARRIREHHVYSEIVPHSSTAESLADPQIRAIVLSGGPASVYGRDAPQLDPAIFELGKPILGICYGFQALLQDAGGKVTSDGSGEYGQATITTSGTHPLFRGVSPETQVWMSHGDQVEILPPEWEILATTENNVIAAAGNMNHPYFGSQFHPEVHHTPEGGTILANFLFSIAHCTPTWTSTNLLEELLDRVRRQIGGENVLCALSGGVDSSVVAALLNRAVGDQVICVFINHGLLRKDEADQVITTLQEGLGLKIHMFDETDTFLGKLEGIVNPEEKRKIIGREFIRAFEKTASQWRDLKYLAQGTLYPDVIESGGTAGTAMTIKTHHNVGGLPSDLMFELVEPLRELFKDEVRNLGRALGLPEDMLMRHPFPGPGLAVRILGEITSERLEILREADHIYIETLKETGEYNRIWQAFCVLVPVRTVGVMGDRRTYDHLLALRAVTSTDGMTADWYRMPTEVLTRCANRIINEVKGINRVVYDISSKPPSTIEWE